MSSQRLSPYGLKSLVECVCRATLLSQPAHIPKFLAQYLSELIDFRGPNHEADNKVVSFQHHELWEKMFFGNMRQQCDKGDSSATPTKRGKRNRKAQDGKDFPIVYQQEFPTSPESDVSDSNPSADTAPPSDLKLVTPFRVKTRRVSSLFLPVGTANRASETQHNPSSSSSLQRPTPPPPSVLKQSGKMLAPPPSARAEMKPQPPRDRSTKTQKMSPGRFPRQQESKKTAVTSKTKQPTSGTSKYISAEPKGSGPQGTRTRCIKPKVPGPESSRSQPRPESSRTQPRPESSRTQPRPESSRTQPVSESIKKHSTKPKVPGPESSRTQPVSESIKKHSTKPKVPGPESSRSQPRPESSRSQPRPESSRTQPRPESSRTQPASESIKKHSTKPKVPGPENSRLQPVPESIKKHSTKPKVPGPESSRSQPRPESSRSQPRPESSRSQPRPESSRTQPVSESVKKHSTKPKVPGPESSRSQPVPESIKKHSTKPKVPGPESSRLQPRPESSRLQPRPESSRLQPRPESSRLQPIPEPESIKKQFTKPKVPGPQITRALHPKPWNQTQEKTAAEHTKHPVHARSNTKSISASILLSQPCLNISHNPRETT
uniref:histone-lysine N-methyltransferase 2D-like n=1 Tax=Scatophagus argus TaxID=75038 RepID=UPI001ED7D669|nr:histone-lysine N-methyltransferase 2D-like [Scatophagus argus]